VQVDGTVVAEREGANAKFYGQAVPVAKILRGEVPAQGPPGMWPAGAKNLFDVLRGAEGGYLGGQQHQQQQGQGLGQGPAVSHVPPSQTIPTSYGPNVGAPQSAWVPGVTAGVQGLNIGGGSTSGAAGPSTTVPPPPPPGGVAPPSAAASAKAAEAAAEAEAAAAASGGPAPPPPPMYTEHHDAGDLPPAYEDDGRYKDYSGDSKTGLH
jgi:hypothetical protein